MKVLLTNHHMAERAGSELLVTELATGLRDRGHQVSIFTLFPGPFGDAWTRASGIPVHSPQSGSVLEDGRPDVVHVTHWPTLIHLRAAGVDAPAVHAFLGVLPALENPPPVASGGTPLAWCVSEEVAENIAAVPGWPGVGDIAVVRNSIAPGFTGRAAEGPVVLRRVAVVSNHFPAEQLDLLGELGAELDFALEVVGLPHNSIEIGPDHLLACDAVISLGRTAIAAAAMGIPTLVLDANGADGWLTPETLPRSQRHNFSGRGLALQPDKELLRRWLLDPPGPTERREVAEVVRRDHDFDANLDRIEALIATAADHGSVQAFGRHCDVVTAYVGTIVHQQRLVDAAVAERDREAVRLDHTRRELLETRLAVENALAQRDDARREIEELRRSSSWRLTAPVRRTSSWIRDRRS